MGEKISLFVAAAGIILAAGAPALAQGQGQVFPPAGQGQVFPLPGQGQVLPPPGQAQVSPSVGHTPIVPSPGQAPPPHQVTQCTPRRSPRRKTICSQLLMVRLLAAEYLTINSRFALQKIAERKAVPWQSST